VSHDKHGHLCVTWLAALSLWPGLNCEVPLYCYCTHYPPFFLLAAFSWFFSEFPFSLFSFDESSPESLDGSFFDGGDDGSCFSGGNSSFATGSGSGTAGGVVGGATVGLFCLFCGQTTSLYMQWNVSLHHNEHLDAANACLRIPHKAQTQPQDTNLPTRDTSILYSPNCLM